MGGKILLHTAAFIIFDLLSAEKQTLGLWFRYNKKDSKFQREKDQKTQKQTEQKQILE